jgi:excisionase family DNA binding protein
MTALANDLLTKKDCAALLHVTERTIDNLRERGQLPFVKLGAIVRFRRSDIEGVLEANSHRG